MQWAGASPHSPPASGPPRDPQHSLEEDADRTGVSRVVGWLRALALEALGMCKKGRIKRGLAGGAHRLGETVVHAVRGHVADARVTVRGVVPSEEGLAERACILSGLV